MRPRRRGDTRSRTSRLRRDPWGATPTTEPYQATTGRRSCYKQHFPPALCRPPPQARPGFALRCRSLRANSVRRKWCDEPRPPAGWRQMPQPPYWVQPTQRAPKDPPPVLHHRRKVSCSKYAASWYVQTNVPTLLCHGKNPTHRATKLASPTYDIALDKMAGTLVLYPRPPTHHQCRAYP